MNGSGILGGALADPLIGEARERQRRRRLLIVAALFTIAVVGLTVARSGLSGTGGGSASAVNSRSARATGIPTAARTQLLNLNPRQAIQVSSYLATQSGHTIIKLGLANVSPLAATVLVTLRGHPPLTRSEVLLNTKLNPGETFRNGTITLPLPANHHTPDWNLELMLPDGSSGVVETFLLRDFGQAGTPTSNITNIAFNP